MEYAQSPEIFSLDVVQCSVAGPRGHRLARAGNAPRPAEPRLIRQLSDSLENARNDQTRSCRVIDRDARSFRVPVAQRRTRPPNPELFPPSGDGRDILVRREVVTIAPKTGEYRNLFQGAVAVGQVIAPFTSLFNDAAERQAKSALNTVQGLWVQPKGGT